MVVDVERDGGYRDEDDGFNLDAFCEALGAPRREAEPVLRQMVDAGFVTANGEALFMPTDKLRQLAAASIAHGLPRADAEQLLQRGIFKAAEINAHPERYPCGVVCLVIFGSYLGDKLVLGDLDIGVESTRCRAGTELMMHLAITRTCLVEVSYHIAQGSTLHDALRRISAGETKL